MEIRKLIKQGEIYVSTYDLSKVLYVCAKDKNPLNKILFKRILKTDYIFSKDNINSKNKITFVKIDAVLNFLNNGSFKDPISVGIAISVLNEIKSGNFKQVAKEAKMAKRPIRNECIDGRFYICVCDAFFNIGVYSQGAVYRQIRNALTSNGVLIKSHNLVSKQTGAGLMLMSVDGAIDFLNGCDNRTSRTRQNLLELLISVKNDFDSGKLYTSNIEDGSDLFTDVVDNPVRQATNLEVYSFIFWSSLLDGYGYISRGELVKLIIAKQSVTTNAANCALWAAVKKGYLIYESDRALYRINNTGIINTKMQSNTSSYRDVPISETKSIIASNIPFHEAARLLTEQNTPIRRACWDKGVYMIGEKVSGKYRLSTVNKNNAIINTDWWANDWEIFVRCPELQIDAANTNDDGGLAYHKTLLLIDNNKEAAKVLVKLPDLVAKPFLMRFLPVLFTPENAGNKIEIQADDDTLRKVEKFVEKFKEL